MYMYWQRQTETNTHRHRNEHTTTQTHTQRNRHTAVFLISSYGAPLAQRASYLALHSFLFGPDGTVIVLSLTALTVC